MLKDRVAELEAVRDQARVDAERAQDAIERVGPSITPQALKTFARQAASACGPRAAATAAITSARSLSASKSMRKKFASWGRKGLERKNGGFWRAQFCTEVARPTGIEPVFQP